MAEYAEHVTSAGERWDTVAYHAYGDPFAYERIIAANPTVPIRPELEAGTRLALPIVEPAVAIAAELLPPWKR
jgi:hypothetical protein